MYSVYYLLFKMTDYAVIQGLVFGFSIYFLISFYEKNREFLARCCGAFCLLGSLCPVAFFGLKFFSNISNFVIYLWALGLICGFVFAVLTERQILHSVEKMLKKGTKNSELERDKRTDVRSINDVLPVSKVEYEPTRYFKDDAFFLGLDEKDVPIYWNEPTLPHIEVCGTTGSGKGVFLGMIGAQCSKKGEAVFFIDPKDDEWAPHVMFEAAKKSGVNYHFININPREEAQINLFEGISPDHLEELLIAGFELGDRGQAADFYKIADRKMASFIAENAKEGDTPFSLYHAHSKLLESEAAGFAGKLRELAGIKAINAQNGLSLRSIIDDGGVVYIVGSMRNAKVMRVQKMLLVRLIQIAEERDRIESKPRQICVILDELKYHLSRTALEALGAARDKGLHVVMAHQSLADLRDCPADLDPESVIGSVIENSRLKLVYRVESPETAELFAKKSGKILVDDEVRFVHRSLSLADHVSPDRHIKQSERALVDENMLLNLPKGCGVLFGVNLPTFVYTSPYRVEKREEAIEIDVRLDLDEANISEIDFNKLG